MWSLYYNPSETHLLLCPYKCPVISICLIYFDSPSILILIETGTWSGVLLPAHTIWVIQIVRTPYKGESEGERWSDESLRSIHFDFCRVTYTHKLFTIRISVISFRNVDLLKVPYY